MSFCKYLIVETRSEKDCSFSYSLSFVLPLSSSPYYYSSFSSFSSPSLYPSFFLLFIPCCSSSFLSFSSSYTHSRLYSSFLSSPPNALGGKFWSWDQIESFPPMGHIFKDHRPIRLRFTGIVYIHGPSTKDFVTIGQPRTRDPLRWRIIFGTSRLASDQTIMFAHASNVNVFCTYFRLQPLTSGWIEFHCRVSFCCWPASWYWNHVYFYLNVSLDQFEYE